MSTEEVLEFTGNSWIERVTYNTTTWEMTVYVRKGDSYTLIDVPLEIFEAFRDAPSKGQYWNANLRNKYKHEYFM